ncbi:hypothetical protein [Psychrobacter sp.]|uniref:hypothetical protein n=1 Tax=Psychrobacter sp. TaxID=56811 RepID=UPI003C7507EE|tara:strand:- start:525 stop:731 length:207 start_codon:yes stop_codon:yes gene_type:complete
MSNVGIQEAKKMREQLDRDLSRTFGNLIASFESDTGLKVTDVNIDRHIIESIGGDCSYIFDISTEIDI